MATQIHRRRGKVKFASYDPAEKLEPELIQLCKSLEKQRKEDRKLRRMYRRRFHRKPPKDIEIVRLKLGKA